jgi:hypothetical protein
MPCEADLNLESLLEEKAPGTDIAELANRLGVSEATVRAYIENRWTVLDRTVLERLADILQCEVGSLLITKETAFFEAFRIPSEEGTDPNCHYLGRPDREPIPIGRSVAYRDDRAIQAVATWLGDSVDTITGTQHSVKELPQFNDHLLHNCVVVGSPTVNPAAEMALCRVFGAEAFNAAHQTKMPFIFRVAPSAGSVPSALVEPSGDGKVGIWLRKENVLLQPDAWPPGEFRKMRIRKGRDYAVIVVLNHQQTSEPVRRRKLVILSGFGGVGTEAAALALVDRYRDLEPRDDDSYVWGVIEVLYRKPPQSTRRDILSYRWLRRKGGRCPVDFVRKKA